MALSLDKIKASAGSDRKKKRIGRGNSSGTGTYSGRGQKGQKSRSGVSNLKRLGMKQVLLRTPKERGFKSHRPENQEVKLSQINIAYKDGETVSPATLMSRKLVDNDKNTIKILGTGELKLKNLIFKGIKTTASAKEQVEKLGGKIEK
jgi:large subunit ribosomal protein L15